MPTLAQKQRAADIRQYFQEKWIKSDDWPAIAVDIKARFGLDQKSWERFKYILKAMQAQSRPARAQKPRSQPSGRQQNTWPFRRMRSDVREYFRQHYAATVTDPNQIKEELMQKFGLARTTWYSLRGELQTIIQEVRGRGGNGELVVAPVTTPEEQPETAQEEQVLEIPADVTPAAKACINLLLAKNHHLAAEVQARDVEIAGQRAQLAQGQGRSRLLKRIVSELLEAV